MELPRLKTIEEVADYLHLKREILQKLCREKKSLCLQGALSFGLILDPST